MDEAQFKAPTKPHGTHERCSLSSTPWMEPDDDSVEFTQALAIYKRVNNRPFPAWSEVLWVLKRLGYSKPSQPQIPPTPSVKA